MSWAFHPILSATAAQQAGGGTAYSLTVSAGAFALSGQATLALVARRIPAAPGAMSLDGRAAALRLGRTVSAAGANFGLTGRSVSLPRARRMDAGVGAIGLAGQAAALTSPAKELTAANGAFAILRPRAQVIVMRRLAAPKGSIQVIGRSAAIPGEADAPCARGPADLGLSLGF